MKQEPIYLDYAASSVLDRRVLDAMLPYLERCFGNAASVQHAAGRAMREAVESARACIAALIGADPREIVLLSGASEANNLALKGVARYAATPRPGQHETRRHLVISSIEHKAVAEAAECLVADGFSLTVVRPTAGGWVDPLAIEDAIRDDTLLVSVMWANNETGVINDLPAIGRVCEARGVLLHSDAAQAAGKLPIDVESAGVHLLSMSAHKQYGPQGVGALYVRRKRPRVRLEPLIHGGGHESGRRSGTLNVAGAVGFGKACELCQAHWREDAQRLGALRDRLEHLLAERFDGFAVNGDIDRRLPNITNVSLGVDTERLMRAVPQVQVSTGAACTSTDQVAGAVLRQMGLEADRVRSALRLSLGRQTTAEEVEQAAAWLADGAARLDELAPSCSS